MSEMNSGALSMGAVGGAQAAAAASAASAASAAALKPIGPGTGSVAAAVKIETPPPAPKMDLQQMQRQLQEAVVELNKQMGNAGRSLGFSMDPSVGMNVITVTNKETGELVRQIPGEDILRVAHSIESLKGIIYSKLI